MVGGEATRRSMMSRTAIITVKEIHCESCERTISTSLAQVSGVLRVKADAASNRVEVSYDELALDPAGIDAALARIGYPPIEGSG